MDSWDDDEFEVPSVAENTKVSANWDDEEEEEEEVAAPEPSQTSLAPKGPLKPKQLKKMKLKEMEEKRKMDIALTKARLAEQANETEAERKAREKRQMEEADFEAAIDAFATVTKPAPVAPGADGDAESAISGMRLLSLADHEQLGEVVANRINASNAKYALECIKVIITKGSVNLTADDMKDLTTIINVIKNDKIAAAKPKGKKKKVTGKQGYANVERSTGGGGKIINDDEEYGYDEYDDFM
uniref:EIF3j n=1 Tax=Globisporangium ultimum (strain ATCC 200006 / CBS 805.95 / DAOM BR144) TaxID=431595 RepID=K3WWC7_GLOUD